MKLLIETNLTRSYINMFFIYTNENIRSKILMFDPQKIKYSLYYGMEGVLLKDNKLSSSYYNKAILYEIL